MTNSPPPGDAPSGPDLAVRQTLALERLATVSDPEYKPKQKLYKRLIAMAVASSGVVAGGYQLGVFIIESYQQRQLVANWVIAAKEMFEAEGSAKQAFDLLENARTVDPQSVDVARLHAYVDGMSVVEGLLNLDRPLNAADVDAYGRAMGQAVMLERVDGDSPEWAILRGQLAMAVDEPERAKSFLETALRIQPGHPFATLRLAQVDLALARRVEEESRRQDLIRTAESLVDSVLTRNPADKWAHLWKGVILLEWRQAPEEAIRRFRAAIDIAPRFVNAWQSLGSAHETMDKYDDAETAYTRALQLRPNLAAGSIGLAYVYGRQDRYEIGLTFARKASESDPQSMNAWIARGLLARELAGTLDADDPARTTLLDEAVNGYSKALELNPRSADVYIERSKLHRQAGRLREAGADARSAVNFGPKDPYAWNSLAKYLQEAGFRKEAVDTYSKVLELDPAMDTALLERGKSRVALGDLEAAIADFDKAVSIATADFLPDVHMARGATLATLNRHQDALADFVKARTLAPDSAPAWIEEARTLQALERPADAAAAAREALKLRPDDESVRMLVDRLDSPTSGSGP
jgi:tetratricopeptide (TPR) repeat protein